MSLEKRITLYVVVAAALISIIAMIFSAQGGRITILMIVLAGLSVFIINRSVTQRFRVALRALADRTGLSLVDTRDHPLHKQLSKEWSMGSAGQLGAWDRDGQLPYVAGDYRGCMVSVRIPARVDYDERGPEATRLMAHYQPRGKINGFTVYHRATGPQLPGHRTTTPTGDETFDALYVVAGRDAREIATLLSATVREALMRLDALGIRGMEFAARGIIWLEPGKAVDVTRLESILDVLSTMVSSWKAAEEGASP